jgi:hypothetical protein
MNKVSLRMPAEPLLRALEKSLRALYKSRQYIVERLKERAAISTRAGPAPVTGHVNRVSHSGGGWRGMLSQPRPRPFRTIQDRPKDLRVASC